MLLLYHLLTFAGSTLVVPALFLRTAGDPVARRHLRERLGAVPGWPGGADPPARGPGLWLQAVSVGEVRVAETFLRSLRSAVPALRVALSATTGSGLERAALLAGSGGGSGATPLAEIAFAFPLDLKPVVRRTLDALKPAAYGSVETEIWPGLLVACRKRGIPALVVNGALSERSARRWRWMSGAVRQGLSAVRAACMQSEEDARRLLDLGADPEAVVVTGNMKFDAGRSDVTTAAERLRSALSLARELPVMVAGSTAPGEEPLVLEAWERIRASEPDMLLILAPRHRERFDEVAAVIRRKGFRLLRRSTSKGAILPRPGDVLLLDSFGELEAAYALADVAFVGGSLVPRGGQNPLEPARVGVPVLFGPGMDNFREIADGLRASGGAQEVADAASLAARVVYFRRNRAARDSASAALRRFVEAHAGATHRTIEALARRIPEIFA